MIQRFLKFTIRKDIPKKNKSINHKVLVQSMPFAAKVPFLAKYHKKKLIALCLAMIIVWTYDLQKRITHYIHSHIQIFSINQISNAVCLIDVCGGEKNTQHNFIAKYKSSRFISSKHEASD